MRIILFCYLLLVTMPTCVTAQMRIAFSTTVLERNIAPLGINLSKDTWHTGASFTKERVRNGSFEGVIYRQITYGPKATAHTYEDGFPVRTWKNVLSRAHGSFLTGPARGKISLSKVSEHPPTESSGKQHFLTYHFEAREASPTEYDALMLEYLAPTGWLGQHGGDWWVFTTGEGRVQTLSGDTPPADTGNHVASLQAIGGTATILAPLLHTKFVQPSGKWRLRFWSKGQGGLSIFLGDIAHQNDKAPLQISVPLRSEWNYHEYDLSLTDYQYELLALGFSVNDASASLDGISMQRMEDTNPTVFRDSLYDVLHELSPGTLRLHQIGGSSFDNWLASPMRRMAYSSSRSDPPPTGNWPAHPVENGKARVYAYGVHDFLTLCHEVNVSPWLCLPGILTVGEARNIIEYLAGPVTTKYGMLRSTMGQVAPWTEVFPAIHLEIGNEAWNTIPPYLLGGYSVKGEYWQRVFHTMRSSQWFNRNILLHAGGQAVNTWLNGRIVNEVTDADSLAIAPYLLHELTEERTKLPEHELLNFVRGAAHYADTQGYMAQNSAEIELPLSVYEINYHVTGGNAPLAPRNAIVSSIGGAVILADWCMRLLENHHCSPINLFTLQHPYYQTPSGNLALWGIVLSLKKGQERYRPLFLVARLMNKFLHGELVQLAVTDAPKQLTPYISTDKKSVVAPLVTAYGTQQGNIRRLLIFNLSMLEKQQVSVEMKHGKVTRREVSGGNFLANNEFGHPVQVTAKNVETTGERSFLLPPASCTLLEWEVALR